MVQKSQEAIAENYSAYSTGSPKIGVIYWATLPTHATLVLLSETRVLCFVVAHMCSPDTSRDIRPITAVNILISAYSESCHLSFCSLVISSLTRALDNAKYPTESPPPAVLPTLCTIAPLVSPLVQCDHVVQKCVSHVLSNQYAVAT
jgi:hypothetical protein